MRSIVTSLFLFTNAISSAIAQALVGLSADPLLPWLYTLIAILAFIGGIAFWFVHRNLDKEEDSLNDLPESSYKGRKSVDHPTVVEEGVREKK